MRQGGDVGVPDGLRFTAEHEWVARVSATVARVGITDYAQRQLNDVVFVQLPEVGSAVSAGEPFGEVESTKSVSDIYSPVSGRVAAVNTALEGEPELANSDPYGEGWLVEIEAVDAAALDQALAGAMDATSYRQITDD